MPGFPLDVDAQLESLRGFQSDLEEIYGSLDDRSGAAGYSLCVAMRQLAQRIGAIEDAIRHLGSETVAIPELAADEARLFDRTLTFLDGDLGFGAKEPAERIWSRTRRLLAAADDLLFAVARGTAAAPAESDDADRRAVVLPFARSRS